MSASTETSRAEALIDEYCAAWSAPDPAQRAEVLARVWSHGATYTDPKVHAPSTDRLLDHIAGVLAGRPGAKVVRTSRVDMHHGLGRFSWQVVQADGTALPEGLDLVEFTEDVTRIRRIVGFFGPLKRD